jgi:L,D-transpeptidase ErfK/SrfK
VKKLTLLFVIGFFIFLGCKDGSKNRIDSVPDRIAYQANLSDRAITKTSFTPEEVVIKKNVQIRNYFSWMDSLIEVYNQKHTYPIDEYLIVHNNAWIIDTLANTDYYHLMQKGIFNEDSKSLLALHEGQTLVIPDSMESVLISNRLAHTYIDVNIPEFRLRIIENGKVIFKFPIRVGQNSKRFLAMANREVDMRTKPGIGKIVRVNKNPLFINPKDNHRYIVTKRDDGRITKLPAIPWLEPELNGHRFGQLIHPTTNMATLGKPYSNGCIGLRESDAWVVYYYAPLGTKIVVRYDLEGKNEEGQKITFDNIYPGFENKTLRMDAIESALKNIDGKPVSVCDCKGG